MKKNWKSPKVEDLSIKMTRFSMYPGGTVDAEYTDQDGNRWYYFSQLKGNMTDNEVILLI